MSSAPATVSVIVPCYNCAAFINETIISILSNEREDIKVEVIAVDDCSSDSTYQKLLAFGNRIKAIRNNYNSGTCKTRNNGIFVSSGEFIAFCDHDDIWEPDKLSLQLPAFDEQEVGLVCCDAASFDKTGVRVPSLAAYRPLQRGSVFSNLLFTNFIVHSTVTVRRSVLDEVGCFDEGIFPAEDLDLWLRICRVYRADYVDQVLVQYRVSDTMQSKDRRRMLDAKLPVLEKHCSAVAATVRRDVLSNFFYEYAMHHWYTGQLDKSKEKCLAALKIRPVHYKYLLRYLLCNLPHSSLHWIRKAKMYGKREFAPAQVVE